MITYKTTSAHTTDGTIINQFIINATKDEMDSLKDDYPFLCTQGSRCKTTDEGKTYVFGTEWEEKQ